MRIRQRLLLAAAAAAVVVAVAVSAAGWLAVRGRFDAAEREQALAHLQLVRSSIERKIASDHVAMADWSDWDGAWNFAAKADPDDAWVGENITPTTGKARDIDAMAFLTDDGTVRVAWGWKADGDGLVPAPVDVTAGIAASGWLAAPLGGSGLLSGREGPRLAVLRPIRRSDITGEHHGWLLWYKSVDPRLENRLGLPVGKRVWLEPVSPGEPVGGKNVVEVGEDLLRASTVLPDSKGVAVARLSVDLVRDLHRTGVAAHQDLVLVALAIAAFCAAVTLIMVELSVIRPLVRLDRGLAEIAQAADPSRRVTEYGTGEVAGVARSANASLAALERTQALLEEEAAERQALMDAMPDRILVVERDGAYHPAGGPAAGSELLRPGGIAELVPEGERERVVMMIDSAAHGQRSIHLYRDDRKAQVRYQEMRIFPIPGGRALLLQRDVTAKVEDEERLKRATAAAEAANRAKSAFLANLSHELRSPLNGIIGMAQLLTSESLPRLQCERIGVISTSAEDLLTLINQLLDLSKIESERFELVDEPFSPADLAHHAVDALASRAQLKGVEVVLVLAEGLPGMVRGDAGRLRQILTNLIANAIKFTDVGEVVVRLAAGVEGNGWRVRGEVSDTGPGITPEVAVRLFRPFEQGGAAIADRYGGTGLGLAIAKGLLEEMDGGIALDSQPGAGSVFRFNLRTGAVAGTPTGIHLAPLPGLDHVEVDCRSDALCESVGSALSQIGITTSRTGRDGGGPAKLVVVDTDSATAPPGTPAVLLVGPRWSGTAGPNVAVMRKPAHPQRLCEAVVAAWSGRAEDTVPQRSRPSPSDLRRARLLVVDDQEVNCAVAVGQLQQLGMEAESETDPGKAVKRVLSEHWDLVLMDCRMPVLDGYEATRRIRAGEKGRRTVIVALTANAVAGDREQCLAAGMDDHLAKPLHLTDLEAVLLRWLGHRMSAAHPSLRPDAGVVLGTRLSGLIQVAGEAAVVEAARAILAAVPTLLQRCADAIAANDSEDLLDAAHTLKGDSGTFLLEEVARPAAELTDAARSGRCDAGLLPILERAKAAWIAAEPTVRSHAGV